MHKFRSENFWKLNAPLLLAEQARLPEPLEASTDATKHTGSFSRARPINSRIIFDASCTSVMISSTMYCTSANPSPIKSQHNETTSHCTPPSANCTFKGSFYLDHTNVSNEGRPRLVQAWPYASSPINNEAELKANNSTPLHACA